MNLTAAGGHRTAAVLFRHIAAARPRHVMPRSFSSSEVTRDGKAGDGADLGKSVTNGGEFDPRYFFDKCNDEGEEGIKRLRRSLLYRSRQTGWLETDLIMGRWAGLYVDSLNITQLKQLSDLCQMEILDIFKWIVKQAPTPPEHDNEVMRMLQEYAKENPPARLPIGMHLNLKPAK